MSRHNTYKHWRRYKDKATTCYLTFGGIGIIAVIALMFVFLVSKVTPLFVSGKISFVNTLSIDINGLEGIKQDTKRDLIQPSESLYLNIEEQTEVIMRIDAQGRITFLNRATGKLIKQVSLDLPSGDLPSGTHLTQVVSASPDSNLLLALLSNGQGLLFLHEYKYHFDKADKRTVVPYITYPFGQTPVEISETALTAVALSESDDQLLIAAYDQLKQLKLTKLIKDVNFLTDEVELIRETLVLDAGAYVSSHELEVDSMTVDFMAVDFMAIDDQQKWLFAGQQAGKLRIYDLDHAWRTQTPEVHSRVDLTEEGARVRAMTLLLGNQSLLVATDQGDISQWFMVRGLDNTFRLEQIRKFKPPHKVTLLNITSAQRGKDFMVLDADNRISYFNATSGELIFSHALELDKSESENTKFKKQVNQLAISPRGNMLVAETQSNQGTDRLHVWGIKNEHSDVSWASLWQKIWYEGYSKAEYIWQSSASNNDFEPKYSLMPLIFGTLKATFYTLILSAPIAIFAAMYTAHFMAPALRRKIKPLVELMEAIPTVILGFFAGLVLSPFIGSHLPGILLLLVLLPLGIISFGIGWYKLPMRVQQMVPGSWHVLLLIPVILLIATFCFTLSQSLEVVLFGGNVKYWLSHNLGIDYDQRNALVVGIAMGFAVIPTIYSIAEDGLFGVPSHLIHGSLALGASQWQTMKRVILPTASPAIFSALMIGLGRAVGETMIILMATGNTPIMDVNIFEGMRTLAANIAVEMPEAALNSSHYRILFLSGLILFCLTFVINTIAEQVRHRLRKKYSSL